jgi:putative lipoic acid-binding regulatory protein
MEFPCSFTFKIIGESIEPFSAGVAEIFASYAERKIVPTDSSSGKYISYSVTIDLQTYDELKALYERISKLSGLRFYV